MSIDNVNDLRNGVLPHGESRKDADDTERIVYRESNDETCELSETNQIQDIQDIPSIHVHPINESSELEHKIQNTEDKNLRTLKEESVLQLLLGSDLQLEEESDEDEDYIESSIDSSDINSDNGMKEELELNDLNDKISSDEDEDDTPFHHFRFHYHFPAQHKLTLECLEGRNVDHLSEYLITKWNNNNNNNNNNLLEKDGLGRNILHFALIKGNVNVVEVILGIDKIIYDQQLIQEKREVVNEELKVNEEVVNEESLHIKEFNEEKFKFESVVSSHYDGVPCAHLSLYFLPFDIEISVSLFKLILLHPLSDIREVDYQGRNIAHILALSGVWSPTLFDLIPKSLLSDIDITKRLPVHLAISNGDPSGQAVASMFPVEFVTQTGPVLLRELTHPFIYALQRSSYRIAHLLGVLMCTATPTGTLPTFLVEKAKDLLRVDIINNNITTLQMSDIESNVTYKQQNSTSTYKTHEEIEEVLRLIEAGDDMSDESDMSDIKNINCPIVIYCSEKCLSHLSIESKESHMRIKQMNNIPENPSRLEVLIGKKGWEGHGLLQTPEFMDINKYNVKMVSRKASFSDILRVHDYGYIRKVMDAVSEAEEKTNIFNSENKVKLDKGDTWVTSSSFDSALYACGTALEAIDDIFRSRENNNNNNKNSSLTKCTKRAMVLTRPPGHHVGYKGALNPNLEDDEFGSNGFCIVNNICIAAAYILNVYRHRVKRIAIVDFDVHHGNGTESIIRSLAGERTLHKNIRISDDMQITIKEKRMSIWLEKEEDRRNVFFGSIHRHGDIFYPQSGPSTEHPRVTSPRVTSPHVTSSSSSSSVINPIFYNDDMNIVNIGLKRGTSSSEFRNEFNKLMNLVSEFSPDIILISAGFDGHFHDRVARGELMLTEDDFEWATCVMCNVADMICDGNIISFLEGGYNTHLGWLSPLSQCVASHLRSMKIVNGMVKSNQKDDEFRYSSIGESVSFLDNKNNNKKQRLQ